MTTTTRTDVHRLAELDPADYTAIAEVDEREDGRSYDIEDGGLEYAEAHTIQPTRGCALCGQARAATWVAFRHDPTGDVIWTGWICAEKVGLGSRDDLDARRSGDTINWAKARGHRLAGDPAARRAIDYCARKVVEFIESRDDVTPETWQNYSGNFHVSIFARWQRAATLSDGQITALLAGPARDAKREAEAAEAQALLAAKPEVAEFIENYVIETHDDLDDLDDGGDRTDDIVSSIIGRFRREGTLTPKQVALIEKVATPADVTPVPDTSERIVITGEVVSIATKENDYGEREVMTVEDDRGFKVWGTVPQKLIEASYTGELKGERVTFTATVQRSDRDESFGFFKRPTKAEITNQEGM
jgi:hypothetical protein